MKLTRKNFRNVIPLEEQVLFDSLLDDLEEVNLYNEHKLYLD